MPARGECAHEVIRYEDRLREAGQFVTVQRRAILRYLLRHRSHPTTQEIARAVGRSGSASQATVYNNLALFADLDLVRPVRAPASTGAGAEEGELRWDIRTDPHHHLRCTRCRRIFDLEPHAAKVRLRDPELASRIEHAEVWLVGKCPSCDARR